MNGMLHDEWPYRGSVSAGGGDWHLAAPAWPREVLAHYTEPPPRFWRCLICARAHPLACPVLRNAGTAFWDTKRHHLVQRLDAMPVAWVVWRLLASLILWRWRQLAVAHPIRLVVCAVGRATSDAGAVTAAWPVQEEGRGQARCHRNGPC